MFTIRCWSVWMLLLLGTMLLYGCSRPTPEPSVREFAAETSRPGKIEELHLGTEEVKKMEPQEPKGKDPVVVGKPDRTTPPAEKKIEKPPALPETPPPPVKKTVEPILAAPTVPQKAVPAVTPSTTEKGKPASPKTPAEPPRKKATPAPAPTLKVAPPEKPPPAPSLKQAQPAAARPLKPSVAPPEPKPAKGPPDAKKEALGKPAETPASLVIWGEVVRVSQVPEPGTVPYTECLTYLKYKVLAVKKGEYSPPELLAVHWGMKNNQLTPAASYQIGEKHPLKLEPFSNRAELARVMQADDTNEYELTPYWVLE